MRDWRDMTPGNFYSQGQQLNMFPDLEGDGYGTLDLLSIEAAEEAPPPNVVPDSEDEPDIVAEVTTIERHADNVYAVRVDDEGFAVYRPVRGMWR